MKTQTKRLYRQLLVAALMMGGAFNMTAPILAQTVPTDPLTGAGTSIQNKATATYQDPNNTSTTLNATSNEVSIIVAEVAGITVAGSGVDDRNLGSVSTGDILDFKFTITNVGNDTTAIYIPGKTKLNADRIVGGQIATIAAPDSTHAGHVYIYEINGYTLTNPVAVPDDGVKTNDPAFVTAINNAGGYVGTFTGAIDATKNILVKVPVTVSETVATQPISVQFGNTLDNTTPIPIEQNRQNIPNTGDGSGAAADKDDDVRTSDITESGNTSGLPANGEREAAAFQSRNLATAVTTRALATVLKTRSLHTPNTSAVNDDQIRYRLDLRVESSAPAGSTVSPGILEGTNLTAPIVGIANPVILVSDVIPENTVLDSDYLPTPPSGWTVVYSNSDPNAADATAINATWTTTAPADQNAANAVKRVGIVRTGTMAAGSSTLADPNGFQFQVRTVASFTGGNILNIAQVFGHTQGDSDPARIIYDESGDQQPNNFNSDGTSPHSNSAGGFDPAVDDGIALATYGSDPSSQTTNNSSSNQGQGQDGEVNLISITEVGNILNGPGGVPGATGPGVTPGTTSIQTDFVNQSIALPAGKDPDASLTDIETPALPFNNTVRNPNSGGINNVVLKPIPAAQADLVANDVAGDQNDRNTGYGENTTLPVGTTVKIDYGTGAGAQSATYTWNGTTFTTTDTPVRISTLGGNTSLNYTVTVNLGDGAAQNAAYPVAVVAFVDEDNDNEFDRNTGNLTAEGVFNLKIDRVYTGFVKLTKEARILDASGTPIGVDKDGVAIADSDKFTKNPARPQPGWTIEYRISYENISTPASAGGSGSQLLNASNLKIFEDGLGTNGNWAANTSHVMTKAEVTLGTVSFYNSVINTTTPGTGVPEALTNTGYVNFIGSLAPSSTGTFKFQRLVK